jgi:hypothetical protein
MCVCSVGGINSHVFNGIQIPKRNKLFSVLTPFKTLYSTILVSASWQYLFWNGFGYEYLVKEFRLTRYQPINPQLLPSIKTSKKT